MIRVYAPDDRSADLFALAGPGAALVDPVDCSGAQGAGLALAFKRRWPNACSWFKQVAGAGHVRLGQMTTFQVMDGPLLVFFPTKAHWSEPSSLDGIARGFGSMTSDPFKRTLLDGGVRRIGLPALGCGEGTLDWSDVWPTVLMPGAERLDAMGFDVDVFPPQVWRDSRRLQRAGRVGGGR